MKSINSIFKNFRKTLKQLDQYIDEADAEIERNEVRMAELQSDNNSFRTDRGKASGARSKIASLIGDE